MSAPQSTGQWTSAEYVYTRGQEATCARTAEATAALAKKLASSIRAGMTRGQVHDVFKDLENLAGGFTEDYYLHPETVLTVTFDEPNGAYSMENRVKGTIGVKHTVLPQP